MRGMDFSNGDFYGKNGKLIKSNQTDKKCENEEMLRRKLLIKL